MLRWKLIILNAHIRKERSTVNKLSFHLGKLEKGEQMKCHVRGGKEIIRIRAEIGEIENRKSIEKSINLQPGSLKRLIKLLCL